MYKKWLVKFVSVESIRYLKTMIKNTRLQNNQSNNRSISQDIKQEILQAITRIQFGSVEIIIHDGQVMQIECREKTRIHHADPIHKIK